MSVTSEQRRDIRAMSCAIFDAWLLMQVGAFIVERGSHPDAVGFVARNLSNLGSLVYWGNELRHELSDDVVELFGIAIQRSNIERPSVIPSDVVCCPQIAARMSRRVALRFVQNAQGQNHDIDFEAIESPEPFDALAEAVKDGTIDAVEMATLLRKSIDESGVLEQDLDLLSGLMLRESAALASLLGETAADESGDESAKQGVSVLDVAVFLDDDVEAAKELRREWDNRKLFRGLGWIGRDPQNGNQFLAELPEIVKVFRDKISQDPAEISRLKEHLKRLLREPAPKKLPEAGGN